MMLPVLRRRQILGELANTGVVEARDLSARFGVSAVTIRRDLEIMDQQGQLTRVRGGAVLPRERGQFLSDTSHSKDRRFGHRDS